ncbi:MAG: putative DNA binding domain-containing protein [Candidatus Wallbacteria bacterium]|nr:putative DNA binding domain-containing protein [Candidatus Wallbacteria bacterium]
MKSKIASIIKQGEGLQVEFKECRNSLSRDVYETVCAFSNRNGGHLLLGVKDNGTVVGVSSELCRKIAADLVTALNNPQKFNPPLHLTPEIVEIEGKIVIVVHVPESPQVHSLGGRIYDRNGDSDFDITRYTERVATLYLRKQKIHTENTVYPFAELTDLRPEIIHRVRMMAANRQETPHAWSQMGDEELLRSAGLYRKDIQTGQEGLTLAAVLLFGKDQTIIAACPHHRTDALLRRINLDRYDDRDDIRTNLIDSYERLMAFTAKHLNDPFFLEGQIRISLRDKIFREAVVNSLIHREYANAFVAKMIIEKSRVVFENASIAHDSGPINPDSFVPHPKNPVIAKVFREIGLADELGSGVRNLYHYSRIYAHKDPVLTEGDVFMTCIALPAQSQNQNLSLATGEATGQVTGQVAGQVEPWIVKVLTACQGKALKSSEIQKVTGIKHRETFQRNYLDLLLKEGWLERTIPDKPQSRLQKYRLTAKAEAFLTEIRMR